MRWRLTTLRLSASPTLLRLSYSLLLSSSFSPSLPPPRYETCVKSQTSLNYDDVFRCAREQGPGLQIAAAGEGKKRGIAFAPSLFLNGKW